VVADATPQPASNERRAAVQALRVALVLIGLLLGLGRLPISDGLRHVGLAFGEARSWGQVYPHSVFAELSGYDPWAGFDWGLRALASGVQLLPVEALVQRLLLVKLLAVAWVLGLLVLCVRRAQLEQALEDHLSLGCALAVVVGLLGLALYRAGTIRPFVLGTLVLVYAVGKRGFLRGALSAAFVIALYPYLAFVYTGPLAVAHALRGSKSFALGVVSVTALAALLAPSAQWTMLAALAEANATRAAMGMQIGELRSALSAPWLFVALLALSALVVPRLPAASRALRVEHVLALCFVPAALLHVRYLGDVVLVLLFVAHGADLTRMLRARLPGAAARTAGPLRASSASPVLRAALAVGYLGCAFLLGRVIVGQHTALVQSARELSALPQGARVLTEFNLQYQMLFVRPDLELVPSCELGVPSVDVREPYIAYFARGRACELASAVGATHFVDTRDQHLDPTDVACLRPVLRERAPARDARLRVFAVKR
jgi:hypothetical protein